jgi:molybdopterin-guanine dinucleotide biosynthesis protein A
LVVATDLPLLTEPFLAWLAGHRDGRTVIPRDEGGRAQPLCARYHPEDLVRAQSLVAAGRRAMMDLMAVIEVVYVEAAAWSATGAPTGVLFDVDTPADLGRLPGFLGRSGSEAGW